MKNQKNTQRNHYNVNQAVSELAEIFPEDPEKMQKIFASNNKAPI